MNSIVDFPERVDIKTDDNVPFAEKILHKCRYELAVHLLKSKSSLKVLDAGCGTGYGAEMMAVMGSQVLALDIDDKTILSNELKYKNIKNLHFLKADLTQDTKLNFAPLAITCFEVIEHITKVNGIKLLKNFYKMLPSNGELLISSPNRNLTNLLKKIMPDFNNPFHLYEYTAIELAEILLGIGFKSIEIYGQYPFLPILYLLTKKNRQMKWFYRPRKLLPHAICRYFVIRARK